MTRLQTLGQPVHHTCLALGLFSMLLVLTVLRDALLLAALPFSDGGLEQATAPAVPFWP